MGVVQTLMFLNSGSGGNHDFNIVSWCFFVFEEDKHKNLFDDPSLLKEFIGASISATSVSDVTKISRATCVRKLETLIKLKVISQDNNTKRYYLIPNLTSENLISRDITQKIVKNFSEFFFICIRAINSKT